ncbi:CorA metal ion transporter [Coemansia sp. RSA 1200]|nr:CorA metal ion transporter [Coemansia sp. RSA 1200]
MLRAQSGDGGGSPASSRSQQRSAQKVSRRTATTLMAGGEGTASLAGTTTGAAVDVEALKQWSGTGRLKRSYAPSHHRKYRLGRWQSRSASSWNPPGNASISIAHQPPMVSGSAREASQSRRSLLSIDISHKPSESRRASITSIHSTTQYPPTMLQPPHTSDADNDAAGYDYDDIGDDNDDIGSDGPLAQLLLRENDEIWNNQTFRFTFYSPNTGTVRATDVRKLRTDDASGLDALIRQALDGGNDGSTASSSSSSSKSSSGHSKDEDHTGRAASASASGGPSDDNHRVVADASYPVPPQLSVTSADSVVDLTSGGDAAPRRAPGNEFLHPNYIRTQFSHQKSKAETGGDGSAQPDGDDNNDNVDPSNTSSSPFPALPEDNSNNNRDDAGGLRPRVYWLDIMNPTDGEITALSHIFNLHPLTTEELLLMREHGLSQDNHKSFRHYDVICYRTSMGTLPDPEIQMDTGSSASLNDEDEDGGSDADCENDTCSGGDGASSHVGCCCAKHMPSKRRSFVRDIAHRVQSPWDDDARNRSTMVVDQRPEDEEKRRPGDAASSVSGIHQRTTAMGRSRKPKRPAPLAGLQRRFASLFARSPRPRQGAGDGNNNTNKNQLSLHQDLGNSPGDETLEEPAPLYVLVFADCVITLHYHSVPHVRNTVARLKLDEDLVRITPDYIAYLLLDDITDTLVPTTRLLELEVDAIDELVLILTRAEHDDVLKRIGIERRHALWLVRLMHGKAEVLRAIERRVQAKMGISSSSSSASATTAPTAAAAPPSSRVAGKRKPRSAARDDGAVVSGSAYYSDPEDADRDADSDADAMESQLLTSDEEEGDLYEWARKTDGADGYGRRNTAIARGSKPNQEQHQQLVPDVIKYLADVHDHLIALTASVHHCERILARAHGNYLARINLELTHASNTTNQLATQMTVLAGIFLPLNLVAGIFGMNVKVPGRDRNDLRDFGLILGGMALFVILALAVCRWRRII